jgi:hypothetical protein
LVIPIERKFTMATIQGVYVALFGRPADPTGLTFFKGVSNDGADLSAIGDLSSTKEYTDRFVGQTNVQIINSIYQSLFGHPADAAGLNFFIGELLAGRQTIQTIAINILDGAQGTDKEIVDRKIAAADAFTAALDTTAEIVGYTGNAAAASGVAFLATVTATAPTAAQVDAAVAAAVAAGGGAAGNTFTLTTTVGESVMGTSADDTISATSDAAGLGAVAPGVPATLNPTDMVDGAGGTDTMNITATSAAAPIPAGSIKNVEILNLISDIPAADFNDGVAGTTTLNASNFMGLQQLWQIGAGAPESVSGLTDSVTAGFNGTTAAAIGLQTATGATMANVALVNAGSGTVFNIGEATAGTLTTANVSGSVAGAGALTVNLDAVSGLTGGVAASAEQTINLALTSNGTITLTSTTATTNDASMSTGNLTITGSLAATTLKGGSGNDILTGGAASQLIEGGAGADNITGGNLAGEVVNGGAQGTGAGAVFDTIAIDVLVPANGTKQTVLTEAGHSGITANTIDQITGFLSTEDKLDFNLAAGSATNFLAWWCVERCATLTL